MNNSPKEDVKTVFYFWSETSIYIAGGKKGQDRHHHCAKRFPFDMRKRIQGDLAAIVSVFIPQFQRGKGMGRFMDDNREKKRQVL
jgi:hypothetical protein